MTIEKEFPILEFDSTRIAKLDPSMIEKQKVPKYCVICFFSEVIENLLNEGKLEKISEYYTSTVILPIYKMKFKGKDIGLIQGFVGSAASVAQLEELIAIGFEKFIVCGGAGVLVEDISVGKLMIPYSAIRDEGTSYHYLRPSREVECNKFIIEKIIDKCREKNISFSKVKTWTTDSFYRETQKKIDLRVREGCTSVEMETAAFFAVAKFRNIELGQILYAGDDLSGEDWDFRGWIDRGSIREKILLLSMEICLEL